jgi:hypothetical protein
MDYSSPLLGFLDFFLDPLVAAWRGGIAALDAGVGFVFD